MTATRIHGLSKECCRPPLRGTIAGYTQHHGKLASPPCAPCMNARNTYLAEQIEAWAALVPTTRPQLSRKVFAEDYLYLIATGETHPETIAARLGTNQKAMERRLERIGLHVLHAPPPRAAQKPASRTVVRARVAA